MVDELLTVAAQQSLDARQRCGAYARQRYAIALRTAIWVGCASLPATVRATLLSRFL